MEAIHKAKIATNEYDRVEAMKSVKVLQNAANALKMEIDSLRDLIETDALPFNETELNQHSNTIQALVMNLKNIAK